MQARARRLMIGVGTVVALIAGFVTVLFFFQPWRSCDYEDTSVGCAMLPADAAVMIVAAVVTIVSVVIVALAGRHPADPR